MESIRGIVMKKEKLRKVWNTVWFCLLFLTNTFFLVWVFILDGGRSDGFSIVPAIGIVGLLLIDGVGLTIFLIGKYFLREAWRKSIGKTIFFILLSVAMIVLPVLSVFSDSVIGLFAGIIIPLFSAIIISAK